MLKCSDKTRFLLSEVNRSPSFANRYFVLGQEKLTAQGGTPSKLVTAVVVGYAADMREGSAAELIVGLIDATPPTGSQSFSEMAKIAVRSIISQRLVERFESKICVSGECSSLCWSVGLQRADSQAPMDSSTKSFVQRKLRSVTFPPFLVVALVAQNCWKPTVSTCLQGEMWQNLLHTVEGSKRSA